MQKLLNWFNDNWVLVITCFLLAFIPLYPKFPLLDIRQTWVYIRLEDFIVALVIGIFIFWTIKKKNFPKSQITIPIFFYWLVGLISLLYAIIVLAPQIPLFSSKLGFLHYARRIEYMALFFVSFLSIRKYSSVKPIIAILVLTVTLIIGYGLGQKFLGWPAFLTMNEEFAKGLPLRLPPTARIPSTFGGHYDLAAFLVLVIPIFGSLAFGIKKLWLRLFFVCMAASSLGLLLLTASRISFGVYLIAIIAMLIWQKKYFWIFPVVIVSFIMLTSVKGASERFYKTLRFDDVIVDLSTGKPIGTLEKLEGGKAVIEKQETPDVESLPKGTEFINIPSTPSTPVKAVKTLELFSSKNLATGSGEVATVSGSFLIQKALVYDISITTRIQGQWPRAIAAFKRNIFTGSGFSSLGTAVDGGYMRLLGETGVFGAIAFLGILLAAFIQFHRVKEKLDPLPKSFVIGVFAGTVGLMANAILIDVFEASKVAFSFWLLIGVSLGILSLAESKIDSYLLILRQAITHRLAFVLYIIVSYFSFYHTVLNGYFVGDDFTWLRWAADSKLRDILRNFVDSQGFFYRPIPKLWYFIMYSIFWLKSEVYHTITLLLYSSIGIILFGLLIKQKVRRWFALIVVLLFGSMAVHHEVLYWISAASHLLSLLFLLVSIYVFIKYWELPNGNLRWFYWFNGVSMLIFSMLSYEGSIVAPIIVWLIGWWIYKRSPIKYIWLLIFIPAIFWLRSYAGSAIPEGDYGVNFQKFPVNMFANTLGYIWSFIVGPKAIEQFQSLRLLTRAYAPLGIVVSVIFVVLLSALIFQFRKILKGSKSIIGWCIITFVSLVPYIGLGGITERYALVPSAFFVIVVALIGEKILKRSMAAMIFFLCILLCVVLWNTKEILNVSRDWALAHRISQQSLLTLKKEYFPILYTKTFVFTNIPIRYGRAWIFPTGFDDALWHLFRGSPYTMQKANDVKQAFLVPGVTDVLQFDQSYSLQKVSKEVKTIEMEENRNE